MDTPLALTPEALAFLTLVWGGISGGIAWLVKRWVDHKIANEAAAATTLATLQKILVDAAERREREANERADKREEKANVRMESALAGMSQLTAATSDLTTTQRAMLDVQKTMQDNQRLMMEEIRRCNANGEAILRELQRRP